MSAPKFKRICPECGVSFVTDRSRKEFCTPAHSKAYNNRSLSEGQRLVALAKAFRAGRSAKDPVIKAASKQAFAQFFQELDALISADLAAGRMHPTKLYDRRKKGGLLDYQGVLTRPLPPRAT